MEPRELKRQCAKLDIDYFVDRETQEAKVYYPTVPCEDCGLRTTRNHKEYHWIRWQWTPHWSKKCLDCGKKTPHYTPK